MERELQKMIFDKLSMKEMEEITKFFIVPVGLPGMGKSTLSRSLEGTYDNKIYSHILNS